jgi:hypothetical protein
VGERGDYKSASEIWPDIRSILLCKWPYKKGDYCKCIESISDI